MATGLGHQPLRGIHQQHRDVSGGCAGHHVARVLFVAGRVGHDKTSPVRGEIPVRHVDGDALLALSSEAIGHEGEVDVTGATTNRCLGNGVELVVEELLGVDEEAADQRRLAIIDRANGREAQQARGGGIEEFSHD